MTETAFSNADFNSIREDLKRFLSQKTEFRDFNFDGSAMSLLVSALAYTANYMAVHANMSLTEVFLDSCQLRGSAVSAAKALGYFPRQATAARAVVKVTYVHPSSTTGLTNIVLPEGSRFSGGATESAFEFVTQDSVTLLEAKDLEGNTLTPGTYEANVTIKEGKVLDSEFAYPNSSLVPIFSVTDKSVDTDYFKVFVTQPGETGPTEYFRSTLYVELNSTSKVFFFQEGLDGAIEFYFGDSVIGFKPQVASNIQTRYLVTSGPDANGASNFDLVTPLQQGLSTIPASAVTVTTVDKAAHGAPRQDIETIKFAAPKNYSAQNRAVTEGDYQALLLREFGFIETISVWGGEVNNPPLYGKVLISIKPVAGTTLSPKTKQEIKETVLDRFSVVGIIPEIVDPDYIFVNVSTVITYEKERSAVPESEIVSGVETAIRKHFQSAVTKFNSVMRFSKLAEAIDESNPSILGSETSYTLTKEFVPTPFQALKITLKFSNPLVPGSVFSDGVQTVSGATLTFKDSSGFIDAYLNGVLTRSAVGSINYQTGDITFSGFSFDVLPGSTVTVGAKCANQDVVSKFNNLIVANRVSVVPERFFRRVAGDQL